MKATFVSRSVGHMGCIILFCWTTLLVIPIVAANNANYQSCGNGWTQYSNDAPFTCLKMSSSPVPNMVAAHKQCVSMDASLVMLTSEAKYQFFKDFIKDILKDDKPVWTGLQKRHGNVTWLTKTGNISATWMPKEISFDLNKSTFDGGYSPYYGDYHRGLVYQNKDLVMADSQTALNYICEKRQACKNNRFGIQCEKQCRCYGQTCDVRATDMTCENGCQMGWMGTDCQQRRVLAEAKYVCVNSNRGDKYVKISIATNGMSYSSIKLLDPRGVRTMPWCDNSIRNNYEEQNITITIKGRSLDEDLIRLRKCPGKVVSPGIIEWIMRIQETPHLVSRNDQEFKIKCDFNRAQLMEISDLIAIKKERFFRPNDVRRNMEVLSERKEEVTLSLINPSTGQDISRATKLGFPVALKFTFGDGAANIATGVIPTNCAASNQERSWRTFLINSEGCPINSSPITGFTKENAKTLVSNPFPLFGVKEEEEVLFTCEFIPCFGSEPCEPDCDDPMDYQTTTYSSLWTTTPLTMQPYTSPSPNPTTDDGYGLFSNVERVEEPQRMH